MMMHYAPVPCFLLPPSLPASLVRVQRASQVPRSCVGPSPHHPTQALTSTLCPILLPCIHLFTITFYN